MIVLSSSAASYEIHVPGVELRRLSCVTIALLAPGGKWES